MAGKQGWNLRGPDSKDRAHQVLENHYAWKGDEAKPNTKRNRDHRAAAGGRSGREGNHRAQREFYISITGNDTIMDSQKVLICSKGHRIEGDEALLGYIYKHRGAPVGETVTIENQSGTIVARILLDTQGASCTCDWPVAEGKCMHLLLMESQEGRRLVPEWPEGRKGKLWNWQP